MNISKIIRERRRLLGLTQEQMAERLGVSAPAVNKWENDVTCPDIALLAPLARLLDTDLNTLLSFQEELTDQEIVSFQEEIYSSAGTLGYEWAFEKTREKIREYPADDRLICSMAMMLSGMMTLDPDLNSEEKARYEEELEKLFLRAADAENADVRNQALSMLVPKALQRKDFEEAKALIDKIPKAAIDRFPMEVNLLMGQEQLEEAAKLTEQNLMESAVKVQQALNYMVQIALTENRFEDAEFFAEKSCKVTLDFDVMEATAKASLLEVAVRTQNVEKTLIILREMLENMGEKWAVRKSRLYSHFITDDRAADFSQMFLPAFINGVEQDEEFAFIRENEELQQLLKDAKRQLGQ